MFMHSSRFVFRRAVAVAAMASALTLATTALQRAAVAGHGDGPLGDIAIDGVAASPLPIFGFSFGVSQTSGPATGGGGGGGKATLRDLEIRKGIDSTSPKLFVASASGRHIPKVTLRARKGDKREEYLIVTIKDVVISSYQAGGGGDSPSHERVVFSFAQIEYQVDGEKGGFDAKTNTPL